MIDRDKFWAKARDIFGGPNQGQVNGCNAILDEFEERYPAGDIRWLAYYLATAFWETNRTMAAVREGYYLNPIGPHQNDPTGPAEAYRKTLRYYPFYGRGLVQLTWKDNYLRQGKPDRVGVDLVANPDKALDPRIAAAVMFVGMEHGDFGGGGIAKYFHDAVELPGDARQLVNGHDHEFDIAAIYWRFKSALS